MHFTIFILLYILPVYYCKTRKCGGLDPLEVCEWDIRKEIVPTNEFQLIQFCEEVMNYYGCVDELPNVLQPEEFCGISLVLEEAKSFLNELCTVDGRLFTRYKLYGDCFKYVPLFYNESKRSGKKMAELYIKLATDELGARKLKSCVIGTQFLHSLMNRIKIQCDHEAGELYDELHHRSHIYLLFCKDREEYTVAKVAISDTLQALVNGVVHNKDFPGIPAILDKEYVVNRRPKRTEF